MNELHFVDSSTSASHDIFDIIAKLSRKLSMITQFNFRKLSMTTEFNFRKLFMTTEFNFRKLFVITQFYFVDSSTSAVSSLT